MGAMLRTTVVIFLLLGLAACAATLPPLTPKQVSWAGSQGISAQEIETGRTLYVNKCSGCHNIVPPEKHSLDEWTGFLNKMAHRAKLEPGEKETIYKYLTAAKSAP